MPFYFTRVHSSQRACYQWGYFEVGSYTGSPTNREGVLTDFKMGRLDVGRCTFESQFRARLISLQSLPLLTSRARISRCSTSCPGRLSWLTKPIVSRIPGPRLLELSIGSRVCGGSVSQEQQSRILTTNCGRFLIGPILESWGL